mgnify:CR=1 FL=1
MFKRPPNDPGAAFAALLDFYNCGESTEGPAPPERLLDWERDSRLIWGDFRLHYGMDIDKEKMHWWQFMALFDSLPQESAIKRRMQIRGTKLSDVPKEKKSEFALLHYKEVVPWIQNQPECLSEQQILTAFEKVSKK